MKVSKKESFKKRKIKYWNKDLKKIIAEKKNIQKIYKSGANQLQTWGLSGSQVGG